MTVGDGWPEKVAITTSGLAPRSTITKTLADAAFAGR
jgi:hypothetical protein